MAHRPTPTPEHTTGCRIELAGRRSHQAGQVASHDLGDAENSANLHQIWHEAKKIADAHGMPGQQAAIVFAEKIVAEKRRERPRSS